MNNIDYVKIKNDCVDWIKDWFNKNGPTSPAVIAISGGKDSSVVAGLCVEALGKDRVIGVTIPNGIQPDIRDSNQLIDYLGIKSYEINIGSCMVDLKLKLIGNNLETNPIVMTNLPPRLRMAVVYSVSQSMDGRVANTCNLSEDYVGYSTKWGDSTGDFSPISNLTSEEVVEIGKVLGLPINLVEKTPSDGLCGKTDEDRFGFSYNLLNRVIRGFDVDTEKYADELKKIESMHNNPNTKKKLYGIDSFMPYII